MNQPSKILLNEDPSGRPWIPNPPKPSASSAESRKISSSTYHLTKSKRFKLIPYADDQPYPNYENPPKSVWIKSTNFDNGRTPVLPLSIWSNTPAADLEKIESGSSSTPCFTSYITIFLSVSPYHFLNPNILLACKSLFGYTSLLYNLIVDNNSKITAFLIYTDIKVPLACIQRTKW